jgi:nicotinamidase-related amidase
MMQASMLIARGEPYGSARRVDRATREALVLLLCFCATMSPALHVAAQTAAMSPQPKSLHVKPRYYRWHVDPGQAWIEKNTGYASLDWEIPLSQAAVVLVDVWDRHYIHDPEARAEQIIQTKLCPLLAACRRAGLKIIHAPSPEQARQCSGWFGRNTEQVSSAAPPTAPATVSWPPPAFRNKTGPYGKYARPPEPMDKVRAERLKGLTIHPDVRPVGDEAVVATGEELHRYCQQQGILFLFYAGFNTNACILLRDYGTLEMGKRGYEVIIVRDCTTGMESFETTDELWQTRGAILFLEMFGKYSVLSQELMTGLGQG